MHPAAIRHHVLVLDLPDEPPVPLLEALRQRGHHASRCEGLDRAIALLDGEAGLPPADLLVLRPPGAGRDGLRMLQRIRTASPIAVVLIGHSCDRFGDRVAALELGADDYLAPGMPLPEMIARIRAVLRRAAGGGTRALSRADGAGAAPPIQGGWRLAVHRRALVATDGGRTLPLTGAEYELLRQLQRAGGAAVDRDTISRLVFRRPWRVEDRAVDGLVKRLRRKLAGEAIASVRGVGYALRFAEPETGSEPDAHPRVENCAPNSRPSTLELQSPVAE